MEHLHDLEPLAYNFCNGVRVRPQVLELTLRCVTVYALTFTEDSVQGVSNSTDNTMSFLIVWSTEDELLLGNCKARARTLGNIKRDIDVLACSWITKNLELLQEQTAQRD